MKISKFFCHPAGYPEITSQSPYIRPDPDLVKIFDPAQPYFRPGTSDYDETGLSPGFILFFFNYIVGYT